MFPTLAWSFLLHSPGHPRGRLSAFILTYFILYYIVSYESSPAAILSDLMEINRAESVVS